MKQLTTLLAILISLNGFGQTDSKLIFHQIYDDTMSKPTYDTIPVLMLCSDTAMKYYTSESVELDTTLKIWAGKVIKDTTARFYVNQVSTIRGYEVRERVEGPVFSWDGKPVPEYYVRAYLTQDKKRLTYFVWDSRQIK